MESGDRQRRKRAKKKERSGHVRRPLDKTDSKRRKKGTQQQHVVQEHTRTYTHTHA